MANTTKATTRTKPAPAKKPPKVAAPRKLRAAADTRVTQEITPETRHEMIATAAFLRAEQRCFASGDPMEDWLAAEREVDTLLNERAIHATQ